MVIIVKRRSVEPNTTTAPSARAAAAMARLRAWLLAEERFSAVVLARTNNVAWITGGLGPPIDRTGSTDFAWAVVRPDSAALLTTTIEHDRVVEEFPWVASRFTLRQVPWYEPQAFPAVAAGAADGPPSSIATDGPPPYGTDVSADIARARMILSPPEQAELRQLGSDVGAALAAALRRWRPGMTDLAVQGMIAAAMEGVGADTPVLLVGGDDRVRRYRHPLPVGAEMHHLVMAVVVARRNGLHVAATRFAANGRLPPTDLHRRARVLEIDGAVLGATRAGRTYGEVLDTLADAYAAAGSPDGWTDHFQGGPIAYAQREFEIAPHQRESHWYRHPVLAGHAVAWNPSLPGGAKIEDTYLVGPEGLERVTTSPGWPTEPGDELDRPAVLEMPG